MVLSYADFYALMPADNPDSIAAGETVKFPQNGPASGSVTRDGDDTFLLADAGTYLVQFNVSVQSPALLVLRLNGTELPSAVFGQSGNQISGAVLVTAPANAALSLANPAGCEEEVKMAQCEEDEEPLTDHLVIMQLSADNS